MGGTTSAGITYPTATDPIAGGAAAIQVVAEALAGKMATGQVSVTPSAANTNTTVAVTFPVGKFTAAPTVFLSILAIPSAGNNVEVGATGMTTSGFTLNFLSSVSTVARFVTWLAIGR